MQKLGQQYEVGAHLRVGALLWDYDRAGGNGTAGMAMAVPVFEGKKMALLGF